MGWHLWCFKSTFCWGDREPRAPFNPPSWGTVHHWVCLQWWHETVKTLMVYIWIMFFSLSKWSGHSCRFFSNHFQTPSSSVGDDDLWSSPKKSGNGWNSQAAMIWPGVPVGPDRKQAPSRTKTTVSHVKLGLSTSTLGHCFYFGGTWIEAKTEPTAILRIAGLSLILCDERMSLRAMVKTWDVLRKETGCLSIFNTR